MSIHVEDVPDDLIPGVDIQNLTKVAFLCLCEFVKVDGCRLICYEHLFLGGIYRWCAAQDDIYVSLSQL